MTAAQTPGTGPVRALVVAKAPVAGQVKTRLGADIGLERAAELAAAALLDTLEACTTAYGAEHCHLALAGDLRDAVGAPELLEAVRGWTLHPQRGEGFAARLVAAHADVADAGPGPVVQVGMDTPQVAPGLLVRAVEGLQRHDAVVGAAEDGGWWVLALRDPRAAAVLAGVEMSTDQTFRDTVAALEGSGLSVGGTTVLRDVDEVPDADAVAHAAPATRFARAWHELRGVRA